MTIVDRMSNVVGRAVSVLCTGLVLLIVYDVIMRYAFRQTFVWMQELEWHAFALIFLWGAAYTFQEDGHVRVDVFYQRWSPLRKAWIDLGGILLFLLPFCAVIFHSAWLYTADAWQVREGSPDPSGLPARYLIKGAVVVGFGLLILQGLEEARKKIKFIQGYSAESESHV